jgi:hypothetical protein
VDHGCEFNAFWAKKWRINLGAKGGGCAFGLYVVDFMWFMLILCVF